MHTGSCSFVSRDSILVFTDSILISGDFTLAIGSSRLVFSDFILISGGLTSFFPWDTPAAYYAALDHTLILIRILEGRGRLKSRTKRTDFLLGFGAR